MTWWMILIMYVIPLSLGVTSFVIASAFRAKIARIAIRFFGLVSLSAVLWSVMAVAPYLWALHLESKWSAAKPTTKAQLESFLSLYSEREIQTPQSMWGHEHKLQSGERMVQYRLLYKEPLDVVYTSSNTIVVIYTSYE